MELKNGDKLSGKIKLVQGGHILIDTEYAGTVIIDNAKISTFSIYDPVKIKKSLYADPQYADEINVAEENNIISVKDHKKTTVAITNDLIVYKYIPKKLSFNDFITNGSLNFGTYYNNDTTKTVQYNLGGRFTVKYDLWRNSLYGTMYQSEEDNSVSAHYYTAQYDVDRFITPNFYWQGSTLFKHDWISNLNEKFSVGVGPGWQVWENEISALSLTGLVSYQYLKYRASEDITNPTGSIKWNYYQFFISKYIKFFTQGQIGRGFTNDIKLDFSATFGISYKLTDWLSVNTSLTKENSKTLDGNTSTVSYNIGVGASW